jgi:hypothetical protein
MLNRSDTELGSKSKTYPDIMNGSQRSQSLSHFLDLQPELTSMFEVAMAEARRELEFSVCELDWYNNGAKNLARLREETGVLVEA